MDANRTCDYVEKIFVQFHDDSVLLSKFLDSIDKKKYLGGKQKGEAEKNATQLFFRFGGIKGLEDIIVANSTESCSIISLVKVAIVLQVISTSINYARVMVKSKTILNFLVARVKDAHHNPDWYFAINCLWLVMTNSSTKKKHFRKLEKACGWKLFVGFFKLATAPGHVLPFCVLAAAVPAILNIIHTALLFNPPDEYPDVATELYENGFIQALTLHVGHVSLKDEEPNYQMAVSNVILDIISRFLVSKTFGDQVRELILLSDEFIEFLKWAKLSGRKETVWFADNLCGILKGVICEVYQINTIMRAHGEMSFCNGPGCRKNEKEIQFKTCARCRTVRYCSRECQKADWKQNHKSVCKSL